MQKIVIASAYFLLFIILVSFSVANKHLVDFFIPGVDTAIQVPLFLLFFTMLILGVILSTSILIGWKISNRKMKKTLKLMQKNIDSLEEELEQSADKS